MRLFISINFDEEIKDHIADVQNRLRKYDRGNFTSRDNMHLTLAFLGEIPEDQIADIKAAMDSLTVPAMRLIFSHIGCFRRDSELWWVGIQDNKALAALQSSLIAALKEKGFHPDSKKFKPHITLAREMHAGSIESKKLLPESFACKATSVSLMLSHRPDGKLTYTELYAVNAAPNVRS